MTDNPETAMGDMNKSDNSQRYMPDEQEFQAGLKTRKQRGTVGKYFFFTSIVIALIALVSLFGNVINKTFGAVALVNEVNPLSLTESGTPLAELSEEELGEIIKREIGARLAVTVREQLSTVGDSDYTSSTLREVYPNGTYPDGYADTTINEIRDLESEQTVEILGDFLVLNLSRDGLETVVLDQIVEQQVVGAWSVYDTLMNWEPTAAETARLEAIPQEISALEDDIAAIEEQVATLEEDVTALRRESASDNRDQINDLNNQISDLRAEIDTLNTEIDNLQDEEAQLVANNISVDVERNFPEAELIRWQSWLDMKFLRVPMSSEPAQAGIRTAILGSLYMIVIVIIVALPVGVGTAIYLEEYAGNRAWGDLILSRLGGLGKVGIVQAIIRPLNGLDEFIETNVRTLAGVPSIIYGLLGLSIFVRALAPVMSGALFGFGVEVPSDMRIIDAIESGVNVNLLLDESDDYIGIQEGEILNESEADALVNTFRRIGTPGINNLYGDVSPQQAATAIKNALDLEGRIRITVETTSNVQPEMIEINFDNAPITYDEFISLTGELVRFGSVVVAGRTLLSAALTLTLLILPIVIINSQEALRAVPYAYREASYGLGATKWQTISRAVLPAAIPGIMTGMILAISRAVGETAPLIVVGASTFIRTDPTGPFSDFTVLPIQIFDWTARPQEQFQFIAAAAIVVLLIIVISLNAIAIFLRNRYSTRD